MRHSLKQNDNQVQCVLSMYEKLDLLSYEVHLNYHISVGEVLGVVCQYSLGEKWVVLFRQHLKQETNTQLLHLT